MKKKLLFFGAFLLGFLSISINCFASTQILKESNNGTDNDNNGVITNQDVSQSWTTESAYTLTSLKVLLVYVSGAGNFSANIYTSSGDYATGTSLCSGSIAESSISSKGWYEITMSGTSCNLSDATKYVMVFTVSDGRINIYSSTANPYSGGIESLNYNSGGWSGHSDWDLMFETYATSSSSSLTFPEFLIIILADFILCLIIISGGEKIIGLIEKMYRYKI